MFLGFHKVVCFPPLQFCSKVIIGYLNQFKVFHYSSWLKSENHFTVQPFLTSRVHIYVFSGLPFSSSSHITILNKNLNKHYLCRPKAKESIKWYFKEKLSLLTIYYTFHGKRKAIFPFKKLLMTLLLWLKIVVKSLKYQILKQQ